MTNAQLAIELRKTADWIETMYDGRPETWEPICIPLREAADRLEDSHLPIGES